MKKSFNISLLIFLLLLTSSLAVSAASLWDNGESMYVDSVAYKKGDVLTVDITESSNANQQASTDLSQSNQANVGAGTGILDFIQSLGFNQTDSNSASGTTSRSGNLSATMSVRVMEVLDDGNLKISGTKELNINGENQKIELTGIVRPEDIEPDNTVESTYLANVNIEYFGKGMVGDKQKPGILSRIFNWLF